MNMVTSGDHHSRRLAAPEVLPPKVQNVSLSSSFPTWNLTDDDDYHLYYYHSNYSHNHNGTNTNTDPYSPHPLQPSETVKALLILYLWILAIACFIACRREDEHWEEDRQQQTEEQQEQQERRRRRRRLLSDPAVREAAIQRCLIIKKVLSEDQNGNLRLGNNVSDEPKYEHGDSSKDSVDALLPPATTPPREGLHRAGQGEEKHEKSTCVICLEPFCVGDVVAWGDAATQVRAAAAATVTAPAATFRFDGTFAERQCFHVFHRECITHWLMGPDHDDCPSCRTVLLHSGDEQQQEEGNESYFATKNCDRTTESTNSVHEQAVNNSSEPIIIMNGLISRVVRRASYSLLSAPSSQPSPSSPMSLHVGDRLLEDATDLSGRHGNDTDEELGLGRSIHTVAGADGTLEEHLQEPVTSPSPVLDSDHPQQTSVSSPSSNHDSNYGPNTNCDSERSLGHKVQLQQWRRQVSECPTNREEHKGSYCPVEDCRQTLSSPSSLSWPISSAGRSPSEWIQKRRQSARDARIPKQQRRRQQRSSVSSAQVRVDQNGLAVILRRSSYFF